jgi:hypothetical protein
VDRPPELTSEEATDLDASLAEAAKGLFTTNEEVRAAWANMGSDGPACSLVLTYLQWDRSPGTLPYPLR